MIGKSSDEGHRRRLGRHARLRRARREQHSARTPNGCFRVWAYSRFGPKPTKGVGISRLGSAYSLIFFHTANLLLVTWLQFSELLVKFSFR